MHVTTTTLYMKIAETITANPHKPYSVIAAMAGVSPTTVIRAAKKQGISRPRGRKAGHATK